MGISKVGQDHVDLIELQGFDVGNTGLTFILHISSKGVKKTDTSAVKTLETLLLIMPL
jgi:hypothetical protein